jgi:DNA-binding beta-propeller fold protein YncE
VTETAFDGRHVWSTTCSSTVAKVDAVTGQLVSHDLGGTTGLGIVCDGAYMWVPMEDGSLKKVNTCDGSVAATWTDAGATPHGVAFDGEYLWVGHYPTGNTLTNVRAADATIVGTVQLGNLPLWVIFDGTHVWSANWDSNSVSRVNPITATVDTWPVGFNPIFLVFDGQHIWVANRS